MASPIIAVQQPLWDADTPTLVHMRQKDGSIEVESVEAMLDRTARTHEYPLDGEVVVLWQPGSLHRSDARSLVPHG